MNVLKRIIPRIQKSIHSIFAKGQIKAGILSSFVFFFSVGEPSSIICKGKISVSGLRDVRVAMNLS